MRPKAGDGKLDKSNTIIVTSSRYFESLFVVNKNRSLASYGDEV